MNKRSAEEVLEPPTAEPNGPGRYSDLESPGYKKFQFLNKESPRNSVLEARKSQEFVPYLKERTDMGTIIPQANRQCGLEPIFEKEFTDFSLSKTVMRIAENRQNDPVKMTTWQNLKRVHENSKLKI